MANSKSILVSGATGQQGGAVINALVGQGFELRALTRKPGSPAAAALADRGITVVPGDLNDADALRTALTGVWGAFSVQNAQEAGVEQEEAQGKRFASIAREAGVRHLVYSSVGSAHRGTGIPHFESKWHIEETVRALKFPSYVILRPVYFMENLLAPWSLIGDTLVAAIRPDTVLQMIAVRDIGRYAARAFVDAERLNRREIDLAGDAVTMPQAAEALGTGLGRPITFKEIPISEIRKQNEDLALMLDWFGRVGYNANIAALEAEFGIRASRLAEWVVDQRTA